MHIIPKKTEYNQSCIEILEECLQKAKAGEMQEIYLLGVLDSGNMHVQLSKTEDCARILGYFEIIKRDFFNKIEG